MQQTSRCLDCRKVTELAKRNPVSQLFFAKSYKDAIASWRQQLYGVLHLLNIRSVSFAWELFSAAFRTKLAINTNTLMADLYRSKAGREGTDDNHSVSPTCYLPARDSDHPVDASYVGGNGLRQGSSRSHGSIVLLPVNSPLLHRGPISDAMI